MTRTNIPQRYIEIHLCVVPGKGLEYYDVELVRVHPELDKPVERKRLDSHWQEHTAFECAERWANRLNCIILDQFDCYEVLEDGNHD